MPPARPRFRLVLRIFVIGFALTLLAGYVGFSQLVKLRRAASSSKSARILEDLRIIDGAIDQYAIEANKTGTTVTWSDIQAYLKPNSMLYSTGQNVIGGSNSSMSFTGDSTLWTDIYLSPVPPTTPKPSVNESISQLNKSGEFIRAENLQLQLPPKVIESIPSSRSTAPGSKAMVPVIDHRDLKGMLDSLSVTLKEAPSK